MNRKVKKIRREFFLKRTKISQKGKKAQKYIQGKNKYKEKIRKKEKDKIKGEK